MLWLGTHDVSQWLNGSWQYVLRIWKTSTVDGIHPAPVEVGSLSHHLQGLYIPGGAGFICSINNVEVVQKSPFPTGMGGC